MELEVLVATMGQTDCSLADRMNITAPAVIANQCGSWDYQESGDGRVRMLSTDTVGVGINRNLALQLSKADILLFSDDDITYYDGALQRAAEAFERFPDADVIFFGIDMTRNGQVFDKRRNQNQRIYLWNALHFGAARMAIRRDAVVKHRLAFSTLFGGGCIYGHGEDTIFIRDCFRCGLRVYAHDAVLGKCAKDTSTWFRGFDDKYFYDRGAMIACAFPRAKYFIQWYFILKFACQKHISLGFVSKWIHHGVRGFPQLKPFERD